jgi:hypothetical protein
MSHDPARPLLGYSTMIGCVTVTIYIVLLLMCHHSISTLHLLERKSNFEKELVEKPRETGRGKNVEQVPRLAGTNLANGYPES